MGKGQKTHFAHSSGLRSVGGISWFEFSTRRDNEILDRNHCLQSVKSQATERGQWRSTGRCHLTDAWDCKWSSKRFEMIRCLGFVQCWLSMKRSRRNKSRATGKQNATRLTGTLICSYLFLGRQRPGCHIFVAESDIDVRALTRGSHRIHCFLSPRWIDVPSVLAFFDGSDQRSMYKVLVLA